MGALVSEDIKGQNEKESVLKGTSSRGTHESRRTSGLLGY
jgi:hypothetical protein